MQVYLKMDASGSQIPVVDFSVMGLENADFFFLTALLTITRIMDKINNREEMKYMCKVIRSDEGHEDPCEAPPIILKKTKIQIIIKIRLNLTDTKN